MSLRRFSSCARLTACAAACAAALLGSPAAHAAEPAAAAPAPSSVLHTVQAPQYGDVLFEFFQEQYFQAITGLMVSQQLTRLAPHDDEAEVLRGGMLLSYGLHREAGRVFERLIERGAEPAVRRRAWYFLAKVRYQRGLVPEAAAALAQVDGPLKGAIEDDRQLLQAQVDMALGRYAAAADSLRTLAARPAEGRGEHYADAENERATRYARYNLGIALIRGGDRAAGLKWLDEIGQMPAGNEEMRALRDQTNVALGYAALQGEEAEPARKWLERVRLKGPQSNKALLGFGWAAMAMEKPQLALVPWTELVAREPDDAAVMEARLAVPFALAELGALAPALAQYEAALREYDAADARLKTSIDALHDPRWLSAMLTLNPGEEMGALRQIAALPAMPHASHLQIVVAQHSFQEAFKNLRDLDFLQRNLAEWQAKLESYREMLAHRRQAYTERLPALHAQAGGVDLAPLRARRDALAAELEKATATGDGSAFADTRQRTLLGRVAASRAALDHAEQSPEAAAGLDVPARRERLRLLSGLLTWELAEAEPERSWQARKGLQRLDTELADAKRHLTELARAETTEAERFNRLGQRIEQLALQVQQMAPQVAALRDRQQTALQEMAVTALQQQQERLAGYATQARFGVAQLHDRALEPAAPANTPAPAAPGGSNAKP